MNTVSGIPGDPTRYYFGAAGGGVWETTDGGVSWEIFNIGGNYESRGLAHGNGQFVSVGQTSPVSGEGAIYTAD